MPNSLWISWSNVFSNGQLLGKLCQIHRHQPLHLLLVPLLPLLLLRSMQHLPSHRNSESLICERKEGNCCCGIKRHRVEKCHQFLKAGYVVVYDPEKAKEILAQTKPPKKKKKDGSSNASAAAVATPSLGAAASTPSTTVGGAAHVSTNPFAPLDSDEDDDLFEQDVGASYASVVVGNSTKTTSALYIPVSINNPSQCIGRSSHVAALPVDHTSHTAAFHSTRSSVLIVDSGATDHMCTTTLLSLHTIPRLPNMCF